MTASTPAMKSAADMTLRASRIALFAVLEIDAKDASASFAFLATAISRSEPRRFELVLRSGDALRVPGEASCSSARRTKIRMACACLFGVLACAPLSSSLLNNELNLNQKEEISVRSFQERLDVRSKLQVDLNQAAGF